MTKSKNKDKSNKGKYKAKQVVNDVEEVPFGAYEHTLFPTPMRLKNKDRELVRAVNVFHFAMVNDHGRNLFYQKALKKVTICSCSGYLSRLVVRA